MDISLFSAVSYQQKTQYRIQIGIYSLNVIVGIDLANRVRSDPVEPNLSLDKYNYFSIWFEVPGCISFYPSEKEYLPFINNLGLQQAGSTLAECCFKEVRWHQLEVKK